MKVLVTGAAGFIGSELSRQLKPITEELILVDNLVNGKESNVMPLVGDGTVFHKVDIRDTDHMEELLKRVEVVFHLACLGVRHSIHHPMENQEVNGTATLKLVDAAWRHQLQRFVYISSSEVYGTARQVPIKESHPAFPHTVYGGSKLAGECYTRAYYKTHGFHTVVLRPFNTFGPRCHHEGDSGEVIPKFMLRHMAGQTMNIFGDGTQTRDFTYVADTARGIIECGLHPDAVGETINLGSEYEITINELSRCVAAVVGKGEPVIEYLESRPGDVLRLFADTSRARDMCGFSPTVSLEQGLQELYQWYTSADQTVEELLVQEKVHNWK